MDAMTEPEGLVLRVACRGYVLRQLLIDADSALCREQRAILE